MRVHFNRIALSTAAGALALTAVSLAMSAVAQGIGANYGAREPVMCADPTQPIDGPPVGDVLMQQLRCTMEGIGDGRLYLVENMTAEVTGDGRAFDPQNDYYDNIDREALIYPISGSLLRYNCDPVTPENEGANCETYEEDMATGVCYKERSGDWNCRMSDLSQVRAERVAPPE
jgi:hypothetical protein